MNKFLLISFLAVLFFSCKKNEPITFTISGNVKDINNNNLSGTTVTLKIQEISGGTFSQNFNILETKTTDASGNYSFTFDKSNASGYRIEVNKANYYTQTTTINPDDLSSEVANNYNYALNSMAWLKVRLYNSNYADEVTYQMTQGAFDCGANCCNGLPVEMNGYGFDTTFYCQNDGGHDITCKAIWVKNGQSNTVNKTEYLTPFDTTEIEFIY